ncbi:MAG: hypothetical protein ACRDTR_06195, partial [Rubrobacter sp.]
VRRLEDKVLSEEAVLVADDGEEVRFRGDPFLVLVEEWSAHVEDRPPDHPLVPYLGRGLKLKHPECVTDPVWKMLYGGDHGEAP